MEQEEGWWRTGLRTTEDRNPAVRDAQRVGCRDIDDDEDDRELGPGEARRGMRIGGQLMVPVARNMFLDRRPDERIGVGMTRDRMPQEGEQTQRECQTTQQTPAAGDTHRSRTYTAWSPNVK